MEVQECTINYCDHSAFLCSHLFSNCLQYFYVYGLWSQINESESNPGIFKYRSIWEKSVHVPQTFEYREK